MTSIKDLVHCLHINFIVIEIIPKSVIIIRLKLHNLQEEDVDLKDLTKDLHDAFASNKPLVHVFDLNSKASDSTVEEFISKIYILSNLDCKVKKVLMQDIQHFTD